MRRNCLVCGAPLFDKPLFVQKNMPGVSQNLPSFEEVATDLPIVYKICQCSGCGLVQFDCDPVSYYKDSTRAGERCEVLVDLRKKQYKALIDTYNLNGKKLIEIGAGKGGFLKTLKEMTEYSIKEFGIEYNQEFVRIAREVEGVNVFRGDIEDEKIVMEGAPYDAFVSFAYPARLIKPNVMLKNIYDNTTDDAVGLIQVPSLEHLLQPGGFYDITRDHISYFDKSSLSFWLQKNGFEVIESGQVLQMYIYAIVKKRKPYELNKIWSDVYDVADSMIEYVHNIKGRDEKVAVWCAGHFAFTVLSISGVGRDVSYIIDNAEFKKNRFSPASHVPIFGPEHFAEEPVENIIILGPIYVDEIIKEIREKCSENVKIAIMDKTGIRGV